VFRKEESMKSKFLARLGAWLYVIAFAAASSLSAQTSYSLSDIGALAGGSSIVKKINLTGDAIGESGKLYGVHTRAFVRTGGKLVDLGTLSGGDYSSAYDVNHRTAVVGDSNTSTGIHAFLWEPAGGLQDLGTLPGDTGSRAFAISDSDRVVGYSSGPKGITAFLWTKNAGMTSLGTLQGGSDSQAFGVNNPGAVVGVSSTNSGERHAFLWTSNGGMQDLGVLPGDLLSEAHRINNPGAVVGSSTGPNRTHAFLWTSESGLKDLGTLGGDFSDALDLNNKGDVVGTSTAGVGAHAFHWSSSTGMQDLNALIPANSGVVLTSAIGINNAGLIVAIGAPTTDRSGPVDLDDTHVHAGPTHAYILTPH
jgi:probable HAF family extracellular repeat protein